jgi:hypothetical protein
LIVIGSREAIKAATGGGPDQPKFLEHASDPPEVLDGKRLVEAELPEHGRALCAAELALRPRDDVDDVAGQEPDQQEDQDETPSRATTVQAARRAR